LPSRLSLKSAIGQKLGRWR